MVRVHAAVYQIVHKLQPEGKVGLAHHYCGFRAAQHLSPLDLWMTKIASAVFNDAIPNTLTAGTLRFLGIRKRIPAAKGTQDFFGVNYFSRKKISFSLQKPVEIFTKQSYSPDSDISPTGYIANEPDGFFQALKWAKGFKLPIIVTGNGTEDPNDSFRSRFLIEHIHKLWHAVNFNWKIQGYFHRSLIDSFEWDRGWTQHFGLWKLDTDTQERLKQPSADLFAEICRENALSSEMVARYAPEVFEKLFPN